VTTSSLSATAAATSLPSDGLRLMAVGAFWFSVMSLLVKLAGQRIPSQELVLVRALITLVLSYVALRRARLPVRGLHPRLLVLRGALGCAGLTCFYYSLVHLPLGEATLIQYTNPVFAAVIAAVVLRERVGAREMACLAASLAGVVLVVRPAGLLGGGAALPLGSASIALLGALCSAAAYVTVRRMGTAEDSRRVVLYLPLVTVPVTLPFALPGWVWPTPAEWLLLGGVGVSTQIAQVYMTRGLQRESAARATAVGYLQIVFAAAWGFLAFGETPGVWAAAGAAVIVASTLALAHASRRAAVAAEAAAVAATQNGTA
jgi:drug/metabolite transporter (DMT)-like permease